MLRHSRSNDLPQPQQLAVIDHISFSIHQGEIFGLVGPSGAGKTTLIRLIATLLQPDEGDIRVFGYDARRQSVQVQRLINRVSVEASFFKQLSPLENLLYGKQPYEPDETEALWQAVEILSRLGLEPGEIHAAMEDLSRSRLQKVVVARALLSRPRLLLLDEPTRGLDPRAKYEIWRIVRELRDLHGITVLVAAQEREEVDGVCDRIATLEDGRIVAIDSALTFDRLANDYRIRSQEWPPIFTGQMSNSQVCEEKITL